MSSYFIMDYQWKELERHLIMVAILLNGVIAEQGICDFLGNRKPPAI